MGWLPRAGFGHGRSLTPLRCRLLSTRRSSRALVSPLSELRSSCLPARSNGVDCRPVAQQTRESSVDAWAYDAESLRTQIAALAKHFETGAPFYEKVVDPNPCQGDVIELEAARLFIDRNGEVARPEESLWLMLGNSCDFERSNEPFTQLVPVLDVDLASDSAALDDYAGYRVVRRFYLPEPQPAPGQLVRHRVADLMQPVTVEKGIFETGKARIVARLSRDAWILFHGCIVRFLARGDRRLR